jgi:hypothetical protein
MFKSVNWLRFHNVVQSRLWKWGEYRLCSSLVKCCGISVLPCTPRHLHKILVIKSTASTIEIPPTHPRRGLASPGGGIRLDSHLSSSASCISWHIVRCAVRFVPNPFSFLLYILERSEQPLPRRGAHFHGITRFVMRRLFQVICSLGRNKNLRLHFYGFIKGLG